MDIKNFIKKKTKKDNTRFLIRKLDYELNRYTSKYMNLSQLSKYLKKNELNIKSIHIDILKSN